MAKFSYRAKNAEGQVIEETFEAENERSVRNMLRDKKLTIISIQKKSDIGLGSDFLTTLRKFQKVKEQALTVFSRQFSTMINAGLAMVRCLDILAEQTEDSKLKSTLMEVRKEVEGGQSLSTAMSKHSDVFSSLFISMVKAGEIGGVLDEVLDRLAGFMERDYNLKKKVKSAMTYPMVILVMAIAIVIFLVTYILPTFVNLFEGMQITLPLPTKILIAVTKGAKNPFLIVTFLAVVGLIIFLYTRYTKTSHGKRVVDQLKLRMPVFGPLIKKVAISRFCRTLGTLLNSGVPIMQALEIVGKVSGNEVVAVTVLSVRDSIREGESISGPLAQSGLFPPMVTQMVSVGEETGNLDSMLSKIADFYDTEVEYILASLTSLLEPIMIVGMGGIVGFIVISVFMPLYQLIGQMSH